MFETINVAFCDISLAAGMSTTKLLGSACNAGSGGAASRLRFSNAARQIDLGIRPRVLSDLLGHRDSESISAYVRIATETLRDISLPVPT